VRRTVRTAARPEHEILGRMLKEKREALGMSQRDIAAKLDRTQAFVWKVEQGIQHLDIATLLDWAVILESSGAEVIALVERGPKAD
jgi:transcriptional regulator with XRE-family HTH domain